MEEHLIDAATANFLVKLAWYLVTALVTGVVAVIGTLLWGRGGRKRLMERLAALEAQNHAPSITQTVHFHSSPNVDDNARQLRAAIDAETSQNLQETIRSLSQMPLGDGHTYAQLPDGTRIVSMDDGTYRLALPVRIAGIGGTAVGGSVQLTVTKADNDG